MKKTKVKIPAKINLSLKIVGKSKGYHQIETVVTSINLYNEYTAFLSEKDQVVFKNGENKENSNAYRALLSFKEKFNVQPSKVIIKNRIREGAGLGSSSADIAGTLKALELLHGKSGVEDIATSLGSDSTYMLQGGLAFLTGRGEKIEKIDYNLKLYLIIMFCDEKVSSKDCYSEFDKLNSEGKKADYLSLIKSGKEKEFIESLENDLYIPAKKIAPKIGENVELLTKYQKTVMTGSGSAVYCIFKDKKQRNRVYRKLKGYGKNVIKAETL